MNKLIAALIAGLFAVSVYAQAPARADVNAQAKTGAMAANVKTHTHKMHAHKTAAKAHHKAKVQAKADTTAVKAGVEAPAIK